MPRLYLVTKRSEKHGSDQGDTLNHNFCIANAILNTSIRYVHYISILEHFLNGYQSTGPETKLEDLPVLKYPRLS